MYISVLSLEIQLSERAVWDSIDRFDSRQIVVPFPYQNMDFHHQTSCFFMFKSLVWDVLVRFVDIDGIFYFYFLKLSLLLYRYFIFFFRKCTEDWFKTWKHTSFVIFCYWYTWYKVNSLLVFHHNILSHVSKVNYHVHAVFFKSIKTLTIWHFGSLFLYF
jgi:hypothetical protein